MWRRGAALVAVVLISCGRAAVTSPTAAAEGFPREIAGILVEEPPQRIISGSATHTEILFAIGTAEQVVAVDGFSDFPSAAGDLPRVDAFNASVEGFAALDPDLVIVTFDPGDLVAGLGALGIPVVVLDAPTTLEGVYAQIAEIGALTGQVAGADALIQEMRAGVAEVLAGVDLPNAPFTYYHELDPTLYSIGSDTFLGSLYGLLGLVSIADAAGGGYPQLSAEFVISADPDFVFLGDASFGETPDTVAGRPGWGALSAVQQGRVFAVDEALSSRWGPRLVEFLSTVANLVYGAGS